MSTPRTGGRLVVDQLGGAGERDIMIFVFDADGDALVAAQVVLLGPADLGVHHDLVALQLVPHGCELRRAVLVDRRQHSEALFFEKGAGCVAQGRFGHGCYSLATYE